MMSAMNVKSLSAINGMRTDTSANRKKLEKILDKIEAQIAAGIFDYSGYLGENADVPGNKAPLLLCYVPTEGD